MKIAVVTEDGKTISRHFGKATQYIIVNADGGKILSKQSRPKAGNADCEASGHREHGCGCRAHAHEDSAYDRHRPMVFNILDCSVVLSGGMGMGAYEGLKSRGFKTVITDVEDIEEAVKLYLANNLPNLMERLHLN